MENLNNKVNNFFSNIDALASLFFRFGIGIAFIIHGLGKFPLPPQGLIENFDLSPALASFVALSELLAGVILILLLIPIMQQKMLMQVIGQNIQLILVEEEEIYPSHEL